MPLSWRLFPLRRSSPLLVGPTWHSDYQVVLASRFAIVGSIISTPILTTYPFREKTILCFGMGTRSWVSVGLKSPPSTSKILGLRITSRTGGTVLRSKSLSRTSLAPMPTVAARAPRKRPRLAVATRRKSLPRETSLLPILHRLKQSKCARKFCFSAAEATISTVSYIGGHSIFHI